MPAVSGHFAWAGARERLGAALATVKPAALLIQPNAGERLGAGEVKPLVDIAQKAGVAAILCDDAALARTLRADGVHLAHGPDLLGRMATAREILGKGAIIGADAGHSRHDAMEAGEAGAEYIAFGAGARGGTETRDDLVEWWGTVFEVPCVALDAGEPDEMTHLAALGADFVVARLPGGETAEAVADFARRAHAALAGG